MDGGEMSFRELQPDKPPHLSPERRIQRRERFVEQHEGRGGRERAREGHPLTLSPRQLGWVAIQQVLNFETTSKKRSFFLYLLFVFMVYLEAVSYVVPYAHLFKECKILKYKTDMPFFGGQSIDPHTVQYDLASLYPFQARYCTKQRRLAAAGRTEYHQDFATLQRKVGLEAERAPHYPYMLKLKRHRSPSP